MSHMRYVNKDDNGYIRFASHTPQPGFEDTNWDVRRSQKKCPALLLVVLNSDTSEAVIYRNIGTLDGLERLIEASEGQGYKVGTWGFEDFESGWANSFIGDYEIVYC